MTDLRVSARGWAHFAGRRFVCAVGRGGLRRDKPEGDGATPVGGWRMEQVFWRPDRVARPRTLLPCAPIGLHDGWSDDPADPDYNGPVRLPHRFGHERMRRRDGLYDIVAVLDHNRHPAIPGAGSAIFVHCWRAPRRTTEGCVAFAPDDLRWILARWHAGSRVIVR